MATDETAKLAVLIDADNVTPRVASQVLAEIAKYGIAFCKRAYGDWTGPGLKSWKEHLLDNSIQPIQQFSYTKGKNSTDSAMIIDAMDLLYSNKFDGFCLVSSDSDFTRLASRIRESGLVVYGCGESKTPISLVRACDKFIYIENITSTTTTEAPKEAIRADVDEQVKMILRQAAEAISDDEGWAGLAHVGNLVTKRHPSFDHRTYGFAKLNELITATDMFEIDRRIPGEGKPAVVYLREKKSA
ncbi:HTH OST-type domain-containing protein [Fusarium keratoplasticum]|nr:HTH OST-type domain-containing protein [Fusarium keratoplasticum]